MKNITNLFASAMIPKQAIVSYQNVGGSGTFYAETFDFDPISWKPINGHPLSVNEADRLAKSLLVAGKEKTSFLQSEGLLPENVLYVNPERGHAIWHTPAGERGMFWTDSTGIASGKANVPPLVWSATKHILRIFALTTAKRPAANTRLYRPPFFNTATNGQVCMGSAGIGAAIKKTDSLETFIANWEKYFFNSYFSHLSGGNSPTSVNIVQLWNSLIIPGESGKLPAFPLNVLKPAQATLKDLLK